MVKSPFLEALALEANTYYLLEIQAILERVFHHNFPPATFAIIFVARRIFTTLLSLFFSFKIPISLIILNDMPENQT
jgi:hypothetical protein